MLMSCFVGWCCTGGRVVLNVGDDEVVEQNTRKMERQRRREKG